MTCREVSEGNLIDRYVAGTASAAEAQALEDHYLTCARCQEDIRLAAAIRESFPVRPAEVRHGSASNARRIAVLAIAAALIAVVFLPRGPQRSGTGSLGRVASPPAYLGIAIRGPGSPADSLFEDGMDAYVQARFGEAEGLLGAALAASVDSVPALFFRATSLLMLGRPDDALDVYAAVIRQGGTPYLPEAHFYRAKALLQLGRPREALEDLDAASTSGGTVAQQAGALADSVRQWVERSR